MSSKICAEYSLMYTVMTVPSTILDIVEQISR